MCQQLHTHHHCTQERDIILRVCGCCCCWLSGAAVGAFAVWFGCGCGAAHAMSSSHIWCLCACAHNNRTLPHTNTHTHTQPTKQPVAATCGAKHLRRRYCGQVAHEATVLFANLSAHIHASFACRSKTSIELNCLIVQRAALDSQCVM